MLLAELSRMKLGVGLGGSNGRIADLVLLQPMHSNIEEWVVPISIAAQTQFDAVAWPSTTLPLAGHKELSVSYQEGTFMLSGESTSQEGNLCLQHVQRL